MGSWGVWRLVLIWFLAGHVPGGSGGSVLLSEISVPESSPEGALSPQIGMEYDHSRAETPKLHESNAAGLSIAHVSASSPSGHHLRQVLPDSTPPLKSEKSTPTHAPPEGVHHSRHPAPYVANPPYNVPPPSKSLPQPHTQNPIHQSAPAPIGSLVKPQTNATSPSISVFRRPPKRSFHTPAQSPASAFHKHHSRAKAKSRSLEDGTEVAVKVLKERISREAGSFWVRMRCSVVSIIETYSNLLVFALKSKVAVWYMNSFQMAVWSLTYMGLTRKLLLWIGVLE